MAEGGTDARHTGPGNATVGTDLLAVSEEKDLRQEIEVLRGEAQRHMVWALLGFSPAALLPGIGLLSEGSYGLLIALVVLVTLVQGFRWRRARLKADSLERVLQHLIDD